MALFTENERRHPTPPVGVFPGRVTRVTPAGAYVEVPTLVPGYEYGPARIPAVPVYTGTTSVAGDGPHSHDVTLAPSAGTAPLPLAEGVAVAVLLSPNADLIVARY